jgi:hypothetical protein
VGFLDRLIGRKSDAGVEAGYQPADAEMLELVWQQLRVCPICGEEFAGHRYTLLATTVLAARNRRKIERFLAAVEQRTPADLDGFHDWDAAGENAEAYALRCPDGNMAIAVVHSAAEPPHFKNVIRCDSLGSERSRELDARVSGERWGAL